MLIPRINTIHVQVHEHLPVHTPATTYIVAVTDKVTLA